MYAAAERFAGNQDGAKEQLTDALEVRFRPYVFVLVLLCFAVVIGDTLLVRRMHYVSMYFCHLMIDCGLKIRLPSSNNGFGSDPKRFSMQIVLKLLFYVQMLRSREFQLQDSLRSRL